MTPIAIYTDGACSGNPGPGGCAAVLVQDGQRRELAQGYRRTTNNRMELSAVILALRTLTDRHQVDIHTDSRYVMAAFESSWILRWKANGWRTTARKPVLNIDLWKALDTELARHEARFHWVKGHSGHPENTRCDELAVAAAKGADLPDDAGFEQDRPEPVAGQAPAVKVGETLELF